MNKKPMTPRPVRPVDRTPTGQLPSALAELAEESLDYNSSSVLPDSDLYEQSGMCYCSYDD